MASEALEKFFPSRYLVGASSEVLRGFEACVTEKWASLRGKSPIDCVRIFLTCTRKWQYFGARMFEVQVLYMIGKINECGVK